MMGNTHNSDKVLLSNLYKCFNYLQTKINAIFLFSLSYIKERKNSCNYWIIPQIDVWDWLKARSSFDTAICSALIAGPIYSNLISLFTIQRQNYWKKRPRLLALVYVELYKYYIQWVLDWSSLLQLSQKIFKA